MAATFYIVKLTAENDECHRCRLKIKNGLKLKKSTKRSCGKLKMGVMLQVSASKIYYYEVYLFSICVPSTIFSLLFLVMKSTIEDAHVPVWYHVECFFIAVKTATEFNIQNFGTLSNTDKLFLRRHMSKPFTSY